MQEIVPQFHAMHIDLPNRHVAAYFKQLIQVALKAGDPVQAVRGAVQRKGDLLVVGTRQYDLSQIPKVVVVGAGKASGHMAKALEGILGKRLNHGLVIVKDGHGCPTKTVQVYEARHPVPDRRGVRFTKAMVKLVTALSRDDLVIVVISGGASSLLCLPASGLSLRDKQKTTQLLLHSGATIHEVNMVRKHLSAIKGGRLATSTPAKVLSLILSDVLDDDLGVVGSGPTVLDTSAREDAVKIIYRYDLWGELPDSVQAYFNDRGGTTDSLPPQQRNNKFSVVHNELIGNNRLAVTQVSQKAKELGFFPEIMSFHQQGEAREVGQQVGAIVKAHLNKGSRKKRPRCLIWGGELTVTVKGRGKGGRAQEFALAVASAISGLPQAWVMGVGTDGTDGPTDVAGAVVGGETIERASSLGFHPDKFLEANDSYSFFKKVGGHIITGPTGTNINDLYIALVF
ncbi:MAG: glycerate kinase [Nitrospirae bacterium]|nr:glycerate kinase [Nitrospirota bacterium]